MTEQSRNNGKQKSKTGTRSNTAFESSTPACSQDLTGLIPANPTSEAELEAYQDLFPMTQHIIDKNRSD